MSAGSKKAPAETAEFLDKIKSSDGNMRMAAWQSAGPMGAAAVAPLGELAASNDKGIAKAASEAMRVIAHYSARTGSRTSGAVTAELLKIAASDKPIMVRANALELIGCTGRTGGPQSTVISGLSKLLSDASIREDVRMALERIPGTAAQDVLQKAKKQADADKSDFGKSLELSIQNRLLTPKTVGIKSERK